MKRKGEKETDRNSEVVRNKLVEKDRWTVIGRQRKRGRDRRTETGTTDRQNW